MRVISDGAAWRHAGMQVDAAYLPHTVFQNALTMNTSFSPSSSLVQDLLGQLQGAPLQQMSEQLGIGGTQLQSAVGQALPLLLGALGNNATPQGAADLLGSVLQGGGGGLGNLLGGLLGGGAAPQSADVLGSLLGIMRTLPNKTARAIGTAYVTIFRNVPLLIQLFVWFYVAPNFLPAGLKDWWVNDLSASTSALISASIGLGLFTAARVCEQVRTGIEALPTGQVNAGYALGFSTAQLYRYIILPQSFRTILPPLSSELTNCVKNTSVASLVGVAEIISQMKTISEYTQNTIEIYTYVTIIFIVINICLIQFMNFLEKRLRIPGLIAGDK